MHAKCVSPPFRGVKSPQQTHCAAQSCQHSPCSLRGAKMLWDYKHFLNNFADRRVAKYPSIKQFYSAYKPPLHAKAAPMDVPMFPGHSSAQHPHCPQQNLKQCRDQTSAQHVVSVVQRGLRIPGAHLPSAHQDGDILQSVVSTFPSVYSPFMEFTPWSGVIAYSRMMSGGNFLSTYL